MAAELAARQFADVVSEIEAIDVELHAVALTPPLGFVCEIDEADFELRAVALSSPLSTP